MFWSDILDENSFYNAVIQVSAPTTVYLSGLIKMITFISITAGGRIVEERGTFIEILIIVSK